MAAETPQWIKFFENAGLPPKIASKYSMLFQEHRIQRSMLADLTKAILNEIGINAVGDVLAILKQAKTVASTDEVEPKPVSPKASVIPKVKAAPVQKVATVPVSARVSAPTKPAVSTASAAVPVKRIRRQSAPDHDVVYRVNMPQGTTVRSRQLLDKAAAIKKKAIAKKSSVFDRLGAVVKSDQDDDDCDEEEESPRLSALPARLRKSVSFACGTKESSPEVSSTTDEFFGKMESDKLARKVSALQRLGTKPTNEVAKVVDGERRLLVARRSTDKPKTSIFDRLG